MSENNEAGSFAANGSGKSPEEVAFELVNKLKGQGVWGERNISAILDMYAECLDATKGLRAYEGQKRVISPISETSATLTATAATQPLATPLQAAPAQPQAQPAPAQPVQAAPAQPVQVQQQALAQAFKPG